MLRILKRIASLLPTSTQATLKRFHFARQIRSGCFVADEPEVNELPRLLSFGDWTIDVGANVGHYTLAMSQLVGDTGRVIALEPMRPTFAILAANTDLLSANNITLLNAAASTKSEVLRMDMPKSAATGLDNPYLAQIRPDGEYSVLSISIDSLNLQGPVRLVKIDAEGHELDVLEGMRGLIARARPALIIEGSDKRVEDFLLERGYTHSTLPGSWNRIYRPQ